MMNHAGEPPSKIHIAGLASARPGRRASGMLKLTMSPRVSRAQARREMALALGVVLGVIAVAFTPRPLFDLIDKLDPFSAGALVIVAVALLVLFRRRRGAGWSVARGTVIGVGLGMVIVLLFFGVCLATQCVG
jgi:hypothetical protein